MEQDTKIKLTQFTKGGGCGCKIAPGILEKILQGGESVIDKNLLVGYGSRDDAAVYAIGDGNAIISTTDFFLPIVDDPFDFGRIASTNAISDVYAMGGQPIMAVAILGWPVEKLDPALAREVLNGARSVCAKAGIPLAGGHSIDSAEPIFGLAVTGQVKTRNIKRNDTVQKGDMLFLTKPLGTGIMATALKRGLLKPGDYEKLLEVMCTLNTVGAPLGSLAGVHAMTDVTGFGLAGHLLEMMGTTCSAEIELNALPVIEGLDDYMKQFIYPDNTTRSYATYAPRIKGMDGTEFMLLCDPQTSGGLLISLDPAAEKEFNALMEEHQCKAMKIGKVVEKAEFGIYLKK
jgi:selenide,water dikinase